MTEPDVIVIRPPTAGGRRIWGLMLSVAGELGADREWSLVGGLMVQLHAFEHGDEPRPTVDIDLLGGAKRSPRMTEAMASLLAKRGAKLAEPPRSNPNLGYRFECEGDTIEILGPDGLRSDPKTTGGLTTFQAAGGSQALRRAEVVRASLDGGEPVAVRRPDLLGAILIKARVVVKKREEKYESDRQDLIRLLSYVDEPRMLAAGMRRKEPGWLREAEPALGLGDPALDERLSALALERARQTLRLLTQESSYSESSTK